jgi:hypothetical protein
MRNLIALGVLASLTLTGCGDYRGSMGVAPDRGGHAMGPNKGDVMIGQKPQAGKGEAYHTLTGDETLSKVAKMYGQDLGALIRRNHFEKTPKAGDQVIVPARSTGGGTK